MPGTENSARDVRPAQARAPRILCAGIIVLDEVFYVENLPPPDGKVEAKEFFIVNGGCAANAAVTVARTRRPRNARRTDGLRRQR